MQDKINEIIEQVIDHNPFKFLEELFTQNEGMIFILKYLYKKGDSATAGELANALEVSTARIALLLKKLEAKNYISRTKDQNDGRIVVVNLTFEGKVYTEKKMMSFVDSIKKIIHSIGLDKLEEFIFTANSINKALCN